MLFDKLKDIPKTLPKEDSGFSYNTPNDNQFEVEIDSDGAFVVFGNLVKMLSRNVVLDDMDSMAYMQKILREIFFYLMYVVKYLERGSSVLLQVLLQEIQEQLKVLMALCM